MHQRADPAGAQEAARVSGLRHALHAGASARRARWCPRRARAPPITATVALQPRDAGDEVSAHGRLT